jgi:hypothetical protein
MTDLKATDLKAALGPGRRGGMTRKRRRLYTPRGHLGGDVT